MTNFSRHTTGKKGAHVSDRKHTSKSTSETVSHQSGLRAAPSGLSRRGGSGAHPSRRLRATLAVLALAIAALIVAAAPASAAPLSAEVSSITNISYASAQLNGKVSSPGAIFGGTNYSFEYATSESGPWTPGPGGNLPGELTKQSVSATAEGLKGETKYFVRLHVSTIFPAGSATSPEAPPFLNFTTLPVDPPTIVASNDASEVLSLSATASGEVKRPANTDPAFDTTCKFEYVSDADFSATGFAGAASRPCAQGLIKAADAGVAKTVSAQIGCPNWIAEKPEGKCLEPATTYHLRLSAENAAPGVVTKVAAGTFTTQPAVAKPTVTATDNASNVTFTTASLSGEVERPSGDDPALDVSCRFEYVTDQQFNESGFDGAGQARCVGPNEVQSLTVAATGGQFRLTLGDQTGPDLPFNATAAEVQTALRFLPPFFDIHVEGGPGDGAGSAPYRIDFGGAPGEVNIDQIVVTDGATPLVGTADVTTLINGATPFEILNSPPTSQPKDIGSGLGGLTPATTYHLRLVAENGGGANSKEAASTFTTPTVIPPKLTVGPVTGVVYTAAEVSGTVDPEGGNATGVLRGAFEYSSEPTNPASWVSSNVQFSLNAPMGGTDPAPVGGTITGLTPGTNYAVRLHATNDAEIDVSTAEPYPEFTTKGTSAPPTAILDPITTFTGTTAHVSGAVDTHAPAGPLDDEGDATYKTDWQIECTPECRDSQGNLISGTVGAEEGSNVFSGDRVGLVPDTYYEVKLVAHNVVKTVESVQTFQTPLILPSVKAEAGASDGEGGYFLQGVVNSNNSRITCTFEYGTTATYPNTYQTPCLPDPSGPDEVQNVNIEATEGQFKLSFRGQTTSDLPYGATTGEVQTALRGLSSVGPTSINVTGSPQAYVVTFAGKLAGTNVEPIKASNGTTPLGGGGGASVSTATEGGNNHPVTVEAHLENLTVGAHYHFRILATNAAGTVSTADREFIPTLAPKEPPCPNETLREENSSLALPECRAYEKVTPSGKEGFPAEAAGYAPDTVLFFSPASNIAGSGAGGAFLINQYVTVRTATGWETIPNLNGPSGSVESSPEHTYKEVLNNPHYSADFRSSLWLLRKKGEPNDHEIWLREPNGSYVLVGKGCLQCNAHLGGDSFAGASDDFSHIVYTSEFDDTVWGSGVYEFVGIGNDDPRRVDLDNSGAPISTCRMPPALVGAPNAATAGGRNAVSADGRVIFVTSVGSVGAQSCTGTGSPPANEIWARIGAAVSVDASASQCDRAPASPGGACNAPSDATFLGAAHDGSRVFFSTKQQLLNSDTDETNDIYECDIPLGTPTRTGKANPCNALREVTGAAPGADVANPYNFSEDGSAVYFISTGVLASNEDALEHTAQAGDHNLYAWRTDAAHPDGQTTFVARLTDSGRGFQNEAPQTTPDGRYLVFLTRTPLLPTDTDEALDLYRYDDEAEELTRMSTGLTGVGGNGAFDVQISNFGSAISDDGQKVVFSTAEPLSPVDGNNAKDVYLWTPGKVSLITTGSVGGGEREINDLTYNSSGTAAISSSGRDIFFATAGKLVPSDGDQSPDVYDARVDGGFTNPPPGCSGEACQSPAPPPPASKSRASETPGPGNPTQSKPCPKGKVKKHGKCIKKPKQHSGKKHQSKKHKRANSNSGGGK